MCILYIQYPWYMVDYVYSVYTYPWYMVDYVYSVYTVSLVYGGLCIFCIYSIIGIWLTMYILNIQYPWYMVDYVYPVYPISLVYG